MAPRQLGTSLLHQTEAEVVRARLAVSTKKMAARMGCRLLGAGTWRVISCLRVTSCPKCVQKRFLAQFSNGSIGSRTIRTGFVWPSLAGYVSTRDFIFND